MRICKFFEITRTIYSKSERSEKNLVTECFLNLFLEVSHVYRLEQLEFKLGKIIGIQKHAGKVRKSRNYKAKIVYTECKQRTMGTINELGVFKPTMRKITDLNYVTIMICLKDFVKVQVF